MFSPVRLSRFPVGFVGKQHRRGRRKRPGDGDALFLAAGQLRRIVAPALAEPDLPDQGPGRLPGVLLPGEFERQHDVLERVQRRHQVKRLEHESNVLGSQHGPSVLIQRRQVDAVQADLPGTREVEARKQRQQRGFAGPGRPDDRDRLTAQNLETDVRKNGQITFRTANLFAKATSLENDFP